MAKVVKEEIGELNIVLDINLTKEDYEPKFKSELNKYRKKAHIKGFRKGKTPLGFIKKMYGTAVLAEVINEQIQNALNGHIEEEKLNVLGQPIPVDDQEELDFDPSNLKDFNFKFELGLAPEFELAGLDSGTSFNRHAVEIEDTMIDEDLENARKRGGEQTPVEGAIEENDMVSFNAEELDGDQPKENGWATTFSVLVNQLSSEDFKKELMSKKTGDKVKFNINELEADKDEEYIRKYFLNVSEEDEDVEIGAEFEAEIGEVKRVMPAELNQEFFDKAFGEGKVSSEEEARAKIGEEIQKYFDRQAESLLFRDFREKLMEVNDVKLPDQFLRRWLKMSNENVTDEDIEKEYDVFAENLKWSLIRGKATQKFELEVTDEEIVEGFKDRVRSYFGGYGDELIILNTANRLMEDRKQVDQMYQELISDKLFHAVKEVVTIEDQKISSKDFEEEIKKARAAMEPTPPAVETSENEGNVDQQTEEEVTEDVG